MKPDHHDPELLTRWIDGELDEAGRGELERTLTPQSRRDLEAEMAAARELGVLMRETFPASREVAGPDLFMHQLAHRIDRAAEPAPAIPRRPLPVAAWFAAAAAVALGLFAAGRMSPRAPDLRQPDLAAAHHDPQATALLASYVPDATVHMEASYIEDVDAVVIVLDGLKPIDTPEELVGFHADDQRPLQARLAGTHHQHRFRGGSKDS